MKKIYFVVLSFLVIVNLQAQYKKASFLTKSGRTYDVGFAGHFISEGGSTVPGIYYSYGVDNGKTFFHWFDLELLLPTKFTYNTLDIDNQTPITITGKSKVGLVYRYNFAGFLANGKNMAAKFRPFATLGINFLILGGSAKASDTKYTPDYLIPQKFVTTSGFSFGANAGLGAIFNFTEKVGIKFSAGYNYQKQLNSEALTDDSLEYFEVYSSHPYAMLGVHFTIQGDD